MTAKLFRDVSASTLQVVINQSLGLLVFLLISYYLSRDSFGELNWSSALFTFTFSLLTLRLDQVLVKRSAVELNPAKSLLLFIYHTVLTGVGLYLLLLIACMVWPSFFSAHDLLLFIGLSQLLNFFSLPFKQVANGKEQFDFLAVMSCTANFVRLAGLLTTLLFFSLTVHAILVVFIISSAVELAVSVYYVLVRMHIRLRGQLYFREYRAFLAESLPQAGVAILMAGITRIDWILLGIFHSPAVTADYSFTYRVFELSPVPLLVMAPILLSRFSRYLGANPAASLLDIRPVLQRLIRYEMILATFLPLALILVWSPWIDALTHHKYGARNEWIIIVLCACTPFQYITNMAWSILFARHRLKKILQITFISFLIMLTADLALIPSFGAWGAAIAYLCYAITEYVLYMLSGTELARLRVAWTSLLCCGGAAILAGSIAMLCTDQAVYRLCLALPLYFIALVATSQLQTNDIGFTRRLLHKNRPPAR